MAKRHGLSREKCEKAVIYVKDLAGDPIDKPDHHEEEVYTWPTPHPARSLPLASGFSGDRPQVILDLYYRHIVVTLLRDPQGDPRRILIEFMCEFTKQFLGSKEV